MGLGSVVGLVSLSYLSIQLIRQETTSLQASRHSVLEHK